MIANGLEKGDKVGRLTIYENGVEIKSVNVLANEDVVLLDAEGNTVAGGIASITLTDANYKMAVKLSDTLPGLTNYTIKLTEKLTDEPASADFETKLHKTIKKVSSDIEDMKFNTAIATLISSKLSKLLT